MGIIRISSEIEGTKLMTICKRWLRRECSAKISKAVDRKEYVEYYVEGEDIPDGSKQFSLMIDEIVPKVLAIKIYTYV